MKVREFVKEWENEEHNDVDVYDNVCEELGICYCAGTKLTKEGEEYFKDIFDFDIEVDEDRQVAIVDVDDIDDKIWKKKLKKAEEFFISAAGYCADEDYTKWFVEA